MVKKSPTTSLRTVRITAPMAKGETLPSLTKTKGLRALLLLAGQKNPKPGDIYEVPLEALRDLLRCRDDEHLISELEGLGGLKVNWHKFDPKARGYSVPVSSCVIKDNIVRFSFDPQFLEAWLDNETGFRKIAWEVLAEIRSLHAAKLYELAAYLHENGQVRNSTKMSTAELRELFGIHENQYPGGTFYQQVIRRSIEAVNSGKYGFEVEHCREGRGNNGKHWFVIRPAEEQKRIPLAVVTRVNRDEASLVNLAARINATIDGLPESQRADLLDSLAKQGLSRRPDGLNPSYLRSYQSALYGEQVQINA